MSVSSRKLMNDKAGSVQCCQFNCYREEAFYSTVTSRNFVPSGIERASRKMPEGENQIERSENETFKQRTNYSSFGASGLTAVGLLVRLMHETMGTEKGEEDDVKVLVSHSHQDSEMAKKVADFLNKECKVRAVAECQLSVFKMISFVNYMKAAIEWSDMVVVLVTENYIKDVKSIDRSIRRKDSSLHTQYGFKLLQHKTYEKNFPAVALVDENVPHNCYEFPELKCVHYKNDFSGIEEVILKLRDGLSQAEQ